MSLLVNCSNASKYVV